MKNRLLLVFVLLTGFLFAEKGEELENPYKIVKDEYDVSIPPGYYVLQGTVQAYPSKKVMSGVTVEGDPKNKPLTNKAGKFEIRLKLEQDDVEFSKAGYHTSYFENYTIRDRHRITVRVNMEKQDKKYLVPAEKPVIYAYSGKDMELTVRLEAKGGLHFTYPQLSEDNTWNMTLSNDRFVDAKGQEYPYLFWDSKMKSVHVKYSPEGLPGAILAKKEVLPYLEATLSGLGLNAAEKTDFITYWGPRMTQKNYAFVQFQVQEDCRQFAEYAFEPKPDHFNRVYLVFTAYDAFPEGLDVSPQALKPFTREGFHVLEWGGAELDVLPYLEVSRHD
ncbi:MAG: hypothetical protein ACO1O6_05510 [Bacteroidota bacterium]